MTVLVTGGAGYIGSHVAAALLDRGVPVVVLDNLSTGSRERIPQGAAFVEGDIGDEALVERVVRDHGISAVMHFAGLIKVEESVREPEKYFENNATKARALMRAVWNGGVRHFIFSSTAAVYGSPERTPVAEDAPLRPMSPYGASKLKAEQTLANMWRGRNNFVILRYFNVAGSDPAGRSGYALEAAPSHLIRAALAVAQGRQERLSIFGTDYPTPDGTCVRDYIHVTDLAAAHVEALRYLQEGGSSITLNCGYGKGYSVFEVCEAVRSVTGRELPVDMAPRREGDPAVIVADVARIMRTLPLWKPTHQDLKGMVADQYRWERSRTDTPA